MTRGLLVALVGLTASCGEGDVRAPALPQLVFHGDPVLAEVNLVTVTYAQDALADVGDAFNDAVLDSAWLEAVGREYGVHGGSHLATVRMTTAAPATIAAAGIEAQVDRWVGDGTLPGPGHDGVPVLYVIYYPIDTVVDWQDGAAPPLCQGYVAYHGWSVMLHAPYAIIPDCTGVVDDRTKLAAHEIIEASTDPFGKSWSIAPATTDPWSLTSSDEDADLCQFLAPATERGFVLERAWSNAAAREALDPCVPVPPGDVYTIAYPDPPAIAEASPGETIDVTLRGWASGPIDDWPIALHTGGAGMFAPGAVLGAPTIGAGGSVSLSLTVPTDTLPGLTGLVYIESRGAEWPVGVRAR